jgi:peptidoglycan hydrolase CwlO-like protein
MTPEEIAALQTKVWILLSAIGILWLITVALVGVLFGLARQFINRVIQKFDELIAKIEELTNKDTSLQKEVDTLKENVKELQHKADKHQACKNFKPIG